MALLPARNILWVLASLGLAGIGLGIVIPTLSRIALSGTDTGTAPGAWNISARHLGLVAGLLIVTPILSGDLSHEGERAELQGTSAVLDTPLAVKTKLRLAFSLVPVLSQPARKGLPDFSAEVKRRRIAGVTDLGARLDSIVQAALTRAFPALVSGDRPARTACARSLRLRAPGRPAPHTPALRLRRRLSPCSRPRR